jgi:hypothetical protein
VSCAMARDTLRRFQDLRAMSAALEHLAMGGPPRELTRFGVPPPPGITRPMGVPEPNTTQKVSARLPGSRWLASRNLTSYAAAAIVLAGALALLLHRRGAHPSTAQPNAGTIAPISAEPMAAQESSKPSSPSVRATPAANETGTRANITPAPATDTSVAAANDPAAQPSGATQPEPSVDTNRNKAEPIEAPAAADSTAARRLRRQASHPSVPNSAPANRSTEGTSEPIESVERAAPHNPLDMKLQ